MKSKNSAFTLVEILIVVIILGILAAIVIPQFTEASNDARESALASDLQTARSQIELFKIQHRDMVPGCTRAADGTISAWAAATMVSQMTNETDEDGNLDTSGNCGPYLQKFPTNPFASSNKTSVVGGDTNPANGSQGWYYSSTTNVFQPADADHSTL